MAVIDAGSNSIKLLVASRGPGDAVREIASRTLEVRLGTGLTLDPPQLDSDGMDRAADAVMSLVTEAESFAPERIRVVATSAVRDAANGGEFVRRVQERSGHMIETLSTLEEARLIGRGIACDPAMNGVGNFTLFDLGGGSLEMLAFQAGTVAHLASAPLGCVRVSERFISNSADPVPAGEIANIRRHVRLVLEDSGFPFAHNATNVAVLTGGTATTLRAVRAASEDQTLVESPPTISADELERWAKSVSGMTLEKRKTIPGLSEQRADIFPAALWTLVELAHVAGASRVTHSLYNLRFGVAVETLGIPGT